MGPGVTTSFVRLDASANVVIVEGLPQRTGQAAAAREVNSGFGDVILRGRYYLVDDPGLNSWIPTLAPFVKVKIPTADETMGLGTGEVDWGFSLEWDKSFGPFFIFRDVSYTFIGDPPLPRPAGRELRRRLVASKK